ncbi:MAG: hypothetical protein FJ252_04770 [Phycisphaerae bacterium]|nr:hypothetical protein [Phycisphaerae bacterium]
MIGAAGIADVTGAAARGKIGAGTGAAGAAAIGAGVMGADAAGTGATGMTGTGATGAIEAGTTGITGSTGAIAITSTASSSARSPRSGRSSSASLISGAPAMGLAGLRSSSASGSIDADAVSLMGVAIGMLAGRAPPGPRGPGFAPAAAAGCLDDLAADCFDDPSFAASPPSLLSPRIQSTAPTMIAMAIAPTAMPAASTIGSS